MKQLFGLQQSWRAPTDSMPICLIGAGGIVRDAHLPAYKKYGLQVAGAYDIDQVRSNALESDGLVSQAFKSLDDMVAAHSVDCIYDLAIPPGAIAKILPLLPDGSGVLIQKPMGNDFNQAQEIADICKSKQLQAAVNFQLRFSPMMLAAMSLIEHGMLGDLLEIDVQVNIFTPWHLFPFLKGMDRVEISVHSIHYLDMIRAFAGNPRQVFCRTMGDPRSSEYAQTRTSAILDYQNELRVIMNVNHNHRGGNKFQSARFRLEGTKGVLFIKLGVLYDYPNGEADELWFCPNDGEWQTVLLNGTWFPDAFGYRMYNLQRFVCGEDSQLSANIEDALDTMALVEACYEASSYPGISPDYKQG